MGPTGATSISEIDVASAHGQEVARALATQRATKTAFLVVLLSALLVAWNFLAYRNALTIGFFCDDFEHLAFFRNVAENQRWVALLECFWQPYLNAVRELYYRPLVETTIAFDSIIWHGQAFGFHLTNLAIHVGVAFSLAWNILQLLRVAEPLWADRRRLLTAFACAGLYSVYPMLGESVIWIIGRVDSLCALFYLLSFGCFQRYCWRKSHLSLLLSAGSFAAAMCCKEMAVTLPVVALLYCWFFCKQHMRAALFLLVPLVAYLAVRWAVLGTPLGGPVAVRSLQAPFIARITDWITYWRLLFPVKASLPQADLLVRALQVIWLAAACMLIRYRPGKAAVFCLLWAAIAWIPATPVWFIGEHMENGRFVYLLSAPLMSALVLIALRCNKKIALPWLAALAGCYFVILCGNVQTWVAGDTESNKFIDALRKLPGPACIVNPPLIRDGVFQFFTARSVFNALKLLPAEEAKATADKVAFLEPIFRPGGERVLNISVLRNELTREPRQRQAFVWNGEDLREIKDKPVLHPGRAQATVAEPMPRLPPYTAADSRVVTFAHPLSPLDFDYLDIDIRATKLQKSEYECWLTVIPEGKAGPLSPLHMRFKAPGMYRLCISELLTFLKDGPITSAQVRLSDCAWRISSVTATAINKLEDSPAVTTGQLDASGVLRTTAATTIKADATAIPQAEKLLVHVSNAHYRLMESKLSLFQAPVNVHLPGKSFVVAARNASFRIPADVVPDERALYELRVGALDAHGKPVGYWSDPVSVRSQNAGDSPWRQ